jgi:hypothetical protein
MWSSRDTKYLRGYSCGMLDITGFAGGSKNKQQNRSLTLPWGSLFKSWLCAGLPPQQAVRDRSSEAAHTPMSSSLPPAGRDE